MYRYIKNKDINFTLWDSCIYGSFNGIIYALSWYLDIVAPGWDAIIKEKENKYVAVFPVTHFKKFGYKYLKQPLFSQQLGLIYSEDSLDVKSGLVRIGNILEKKYNQISEYPLNTGNLVDVIPGFKVEMQKTYHLDLFKPYDEIWNNYKKNRKYEVCHAKKLNLLLLPTSNIDGLIELFNNNTAYRIPGVKNNQEIYQKLKKVYQEAAIRNLTIFYEVRSSHGEVLAMALFLQFKNKIIYLFSTITLKGKKNKAMILLLDYIIGEYSQKNFLLDFEGSEIPGIADFYRRFGAEKIEFNSISKSNLPFPIRQIQKLVAPFRRHG